MGVFYTFLSILFVLIGLTLVICLHELGHLYFAKRYGVYCFEYSIGFGPKIFSKRRKGHETKVSLRCLPLGGYVAMAGEEEDDDEKDFGDADEPVVPKNRTLAGVSKPKQVLIMFGGVLVNFILAFALFFAKNLIYPVANTNSNYLTVVQDSPLTEAGLVTGDKIISFDEIQFSDKTTQEEYDNLIKKNDDYESLFIKDVNNFNDVSLTLYYNEGAGAIFDLRPTDVDQTITRTLTYERQILDENGNIKVETEKTSFTIKSYLVDNKLAIDDPNRYAYEIQGFQANQYKMTFGEAFVQSFVDFGMSIYNVIYALGSLFTPQGINNVGGLISIFAVNEQAMKSGFSTVLYMWGLISANLGVMNLIPIPGLDGWQICVATYEGITKKKVSSKLKAILNTIGFLLMIGLGVLLIIWDIIRLF